jgi:hypothetical protein
VVVRRDVDPRGHPPDFHLRRQPAAARRAGDAVESALFDAHLVFETGAIYSLRPAAPRMMLAPRDPTLGGANLFHDVRQFAYMTVSPP